MKETPHFPEENSSDKSKLIRKLGTYAAIGVAGALAISAVKEGVKNVREEGQKERQKIESVEKHGIPPPGEYLINVFGDRIFLRNPNDKEYILPAQGNKFGRIFNGVFTGFNYNKLIIREDGKVLFDANWKISKSDDKNIPPPGEYHVDIINSEPVLKDQNGNKYDFSKNAEGKKFHLPIAFDYHQLIILEDGRVFYDSNMKIPIVQNTSEDKQ